MHLCSAREPRPAGRIRNRRRSRRRKAARDWCPGHRRRPTPAVPLARRQAGHHRCDRGRLGHLQPPPERCREPCPCVVVLALVIVETDKIVRLFLTPTFRRGRSIEVTHAESALRTPKKRRPPASFAPMCNSTTSQSSLRCWRDPSTKRPPAAALNSPCEHSS